MPVRGQAFDRGALPAQRHRDLARLNRDGILALPLDDALALFDEAMSVDEPFLVPARIDRVALRPKSAPGSTSIGGLVPGPGRCGSPAAGSPALMTCAVPAAARGGP